LGTLGFPEMAVIVVLALLVFGPERLPELAKKAGEMIAKFRAEAGRSVEELKRAADIEDLDREFRALSADVRSVRDSVTKSLTSTVTGAAGPRPDNSPPPTDPDAT
jgi:sec-independent protein translocase protein TatB